MAKPIIGMIPPNGWHFKEGDVVLKGYSLENLYHVVTNYRAENHLPLNDVRGDVDSFLCSNHPNNCHGVDMVVVTSVVPPNRSSELLNDITVWAKNILHSKSPVDMVPDDVADKRAKTCLSCPKNLNWRAGCGACIIAADRLSASIRQARETKSTPVLGGCSVMRHDNRSAVFFDKKHFTLNNNLPAECWLNDNG